MGWGLRPHPCSRYLRELLGTGVYSHFVLVLHPYTNYMEASQEASIRSGYAFPHTLSVSRYAPSLSQGV